MKKFFWLSLALMVITLSASACSSSKTANQKEVLEQNSKQVEIDQLKEEVDRLSAENNSLKETPVVEESAEKEVKNLTKNQCAQNPTKVSTLKVGGYYNTHKIKDISGNFLEKNCEVSCAEPISGKIIFDGEESVSGYLVRNEGYFGVVSFVPDDKNWVPVFSLQDKTTDNSFVLKGLTCAEYLLLDIESVSGDMFDIPALSELPGIRDFLVNSNDGDKYSKRVSITVKDFQTSFTTGGESGSWAKLVSAKIIK